jgi:outer membrane receptor protein involved in Fe transport
LNTTYGLTENLDAGLDIENLHLLNIWSRYSLLNNRTGVSVAATGGAFTHAYTNTDGLYVGALLSYQGHSRLTINTGYRYSKVSYDPAEYNNSYDLLPVINNQEDLSATGQLSLSIAYRLKPHLQLTAGAVCQYQHKNQDEHVKSELCLPLLGLSFFSR